MPLLKDYYQILGIDPSATRADIIAAYRRLARQHHPDVDASPDAVRRMQDINEAHYVLSDSGRRARYDRAWTMRAGAKVDVADAEAARRTGEWARRTEETEQQKQWAEYERRWRAAAAKRRAEDARRHSFIQAALVVAITTVLLILAYAAGHLGAVLGVLPWIGLLYIAFGLWLGHGQQVRVEQAPPRAEHVQHTHHPPEPAERFYTIRVLLLLAVVFFWIFSTLFLMPAMSAIRVPASIILLALWSEGPLLCLAAIWATRGQK